GAAARRGAPPPLPRAGRPRRPAEVVDDHVECAPLGELVTPPIRTRSTILKGELTHGQCAHGSGEDTGREGQGRCAGHAARRAGGGGAEGGAGLPRLPPASLHQGSRSVSLLRDVQGRRGLRRAPQGAVPRRLSRAPGEGRTDRGSRRGGDLPLAHRVICAPRRGTLAGPERAAATFQRRIPFPASSVLICETTVLTRADPTPRHT